MALKIVVALVVVLGVFIAYVSTRDPHFRYEKSWVIQSTPERIYPYLSSFEKGNEWSAYMKNDPTMKAQIAGPESQPGTRLNFGSDLSDPLGYLEFKALTPNEKVEMGLTMLKPFKADSNVEYILAPEGEATRFTWVMSGENGFIGKLITVLVNCEKLATAEWDPSVANLKQLVETQP